MNDENNNESNDAVSSHKFYAKMCNLYISIREFSEIIKTLSTMSKQKQNALFENFTKDELKTIDEMNLGICEANRIINDAHIVFNGGVLSNYARFGHLKQESKYWDNLELCKNVAPIKIIIDYLAKHFFEKYGKDSKDSEYGENEQRDYYTPFTYSSYKEPYEEEKCRSQFSNSHEYFQYLEKPYLPDYGFNVYKSPGGFENIYRISAKQHNWYYTGVIFNYNISNESFTLVKLYSISATGRGGVFDSGDNDMSIPVSDGVEEVIEICKDILEEHFHTDTIQKYIQIINEIKTTATNDSNDA